jgi:hypothetical protein
MGRITSPFATTGEAPIPCTLANGPNGAYQRRRPALSKETRPESGKNAYTEPPSTAGVGAAGSFKLCIVCACRRWTDRSQMMRPVLRSRQTTNRWSPRAPVMNNLSPDTTGDDFPRGTSTRQSSVRSTLNSAGASVADATPDPRGPLNRFQPSSNGFAVTYAVRAKQQMAARSASGMNTSSAARLDLRTRPVIRLCQYTRCPKSSRHRIMIPPR